MLLFTFLIATSTPAAWVAVAASAPSATVDADRAKELHLQATAEYETFEYERAITLWTEAYRLVGNDPSFDQTRNAIVFNIATARTKQFDIDGDRDHLKKAEMLLVRYLEDFAAIHGPGEKLDAERVKVAPRLADLQARLAGTETEAQAPAVVEPPETELDAASPDEQATPPPSGPPPSNKFVVFTAAGSAVAAVGLGGLAVMAVGLSRGAAANADGDDLAVPVSKIDDIGTRGRRANLMAIVGGVAGGALLGAGGALIGIGVKHKNAKGGGLSLVTGPELVGLQWRSRF